MLQSTKAESFVGIIVGVFILAVVMLGIVNILIFSADLTTQYNKTNRIQVLTQNATNIIRKLDTSMIPENEMFYIYKNASDTPGEGNYEVFSGSGNENYQYIDETGNNILDISSYDGDVYSQILWIASKDNTFGIDNQIIEVNIEKLVRR